MDSPHMHHLFLNRFAKFTLVLICSCHQLQIIGDSRERTHVRVFAFHLSAMGLKNMLQEEYKLVNDSSFINQSAASSAGYCLLLKFM
jgi:hypothetical protein